MQKLLTTLVIVLLVIRIWGEPLATVTRAQSIVNWSIQPGSTASGSCTPSFACDGSPNNVRDDNSSTAYTGGCQTSGGGNCNFIYSDTVTFPQAATINQVEIFHSGGGGGCEVGLSGEVSLNIGGVWTTVLSFNLFTFAGTGGSPITSSATGPWSNVLGISVGVGGGARSRYPPPECMIATIIHRSFELRAWGPATCNSGEDAGLRAYDGLAVIKIAAEPVGTLTSILRFFKNGIVRGITLVDPSDPNASRFRVWTPVGVKVLCRLP